MVIGLFHYLVNAVIEDDQNDQIVEVLVVLEQITTMTEIGFEFD